MARLNRGRTRYLLLLGLALVACTAAARARSARETAEMLTVPSIELEEATVEATVDYLRTLSKELDPDHRGLNFFLKLDPAIKGRSTITMSLSRIAMADVIKYMCMAAGLNYAYDGDVVIIADRHLAIPQMETRFYRVQPGVIPTLKTRRTKTWKEAAGDDDEDD